MSLAEQQKMLDLITRESKKMKSLDENLSLEIEQEEDLQIELKKANEKKKRKISMILMKSSMMLKKSRPFFKQSSVKLRLWELHSLLRLSNYSII